MCDFQDRLREDLERFLQEEGEKEREVWFNSTLFCATFVVLFASVLYWLLEGGEWLIGFQDVVFLSSRASLSTTFLINGVEVKASGQPHVLKLWLGVSKGMLQQSLFLSRLNFMEIMRLS